MVTPRYLVLLNTLERETIDGIWWQGLTLLSVEDDGLSFSGLCSLP